MVNLITSPDVIYNENALYYFKKEVEVKEIKRSIVYLFADARYKLYINGSLASVGPCKPTSEIKFYDEVDVTEFIKSGINLIEVQVLQLENKPYTQENSFLESVVRTGDMVMGMWGNFGDAEITTDDTWNVAKENDIEFFCDKIYNIHGMATLSEKIGLNFKKDLSFKKAVLRDVLYRIDVEKGPWSQFTVIAEKRAIPMPYFKKQNFTKVTDCIYDAGYLTCGFIKLRLKGKGEVRLTCGECMSFPENGKLIKRKRDDLNGGVYGDIDYIKVDGEAVFEPFWMRTFRYIKIEAEGEIEVVSLNYLETGYPLEVSENYDFGNDVDNKLFDMSVNTLKRCMHETYMDCPYHEQLQYTMDTHMQIMFTYQLTCDKALPEKAIDDYAKSYRVGGLVQSRYPTNKLLYIPGFSLFYILMVYEHYKRFGDKKFTKKYIRVADGVIDWFEERLTDFMVPPSNLWNFQDWPKDFYFGQSPGDGLIGIYSLMLAYSLDKLYEMHKDLGNDMKAYLELSENIKKSVKEKCYDEEKGLYADTPEKEHFSQHMQLWAVLCGMEDGDNAKEILKKSMKLDCKVTVAYYYLLLRAFEEADMYDMADECMDVLRNLVHLGCTSMPEWEREDTRSECHAWGAVAIYEFTAKVLGVTYKDNTIYIKPYISGRSSAKGEVATPVGMVYVEWSVKDGEFCIDIKLPESATAILTMPDNSVNGIKNGVYTAKV